MTSARVRRSTGTATTPPTDLCADVPNGVYQVDLRMGHQGPYVLTQMGIFLEGTQVGTVSLPLAHYATESYVWRSTMGN